MTKLPSVQVDCQQKLSHSCWCLQGTWVDTWGKISFYCHAALPSVSYLIMSLLVCPIQKSCFLVFSSQDLKSLDEKNCSVHTVLSKSGIPEAQLPLFIYIFPTVLSLYVYPWRSLQSTNAHTSKSIPHAQCASPYLLHPTLSVY